MKAYFIAYEIVHDPESLRSLAPQVLPIIQAQQGRFLVRGGAFTALEGEMPYQRVAVLEFPSRAAAESFWNSPEYQRIVPLRRKWADYQIILADGVES
jgi:uncharacterized protein (DUF1330 family)